MPAADGPTGASYGGPMAAEAYLVGGVRTPVGRYGGALAGVRADDLAALVVGEAVRRAGVDPDRVDEVVLGAANQAGEDNRNVARMAVLLAGPAAARARPTRSTGCAPPASPPSRAPRTRCCPASADVVVAGGVESMTRAPWVMAKPGTPWAKPGEVHDTALGWRFVNPQHDPEHTITLGETAERVAALDGITREESDAFGPAEPGARGQGRRERRVRRRDRPGARPGRASRTSSSPATRRSAPPAWTSSPRSSPPSPRTASSRPAPAARCRTARRRSSSPPRRRCATSA